MRYIDAIGGMSKIKGGFAAMFCWEYLLMIISNISMVKAYKNLLKIAGIIHIWKAFASESNEYEYGYGAEAFEAFQKNNAYKSDTAIVNDDMKKIR